MRRGRRDEDALCAGGKGQLGNQLSPSTLLTHLRGPPMLSYGHFGSSLGSTNQRSSAATHCTDRQTASKIARIPLLEADVLHPYRDLIEIISVARSDKSLDLIRWPGWPFRHARRSTARQRAVQVRGRCCLTRGRSTAWGGFLRPQHPWLPDSHWLPLPRWARSRRKLRQGVTSPSTTYNPIREGSSGAQAKAMECLLHSAGFATTVNGHFSAADAKELAKFRKSIGLQPDSRGRTSRLERIALAGHDPPPRGW